MTLKFGVIGAGVIGQLRAQTVRAHPETSLAAVFDPNPEAAAAVATGDVVAARSLEEFLDRPLDAVIISSPVHLHEAACLEAFARGLHILCEKPMTNTVTACQTIVAAATAADRILAVGFNIRYYPSMQFIREIVASGQIGELDHVRLFGGHDGLANFRADWQYRSPESGGGATMDIGIHMADLGRYLLGDITEIYGIASERVWGIPGSEDNAMALLRNPAGIGASYHATWNEWSGFRVAVEAYGRLGMVSASYGPMRNLLITHETPGARRRVTRKLYPEVILREKLRSWKVTTEMSFAEELNCFVNRINGVGGGLLADGHDGLRSVEVAYALRKSSETREVVHLPVLGPMRG